MYLHDRESNFCENDFEIWLFRIRIQKVLVSEPDPNSFPGLKMKYTWTSIVFSLKNLLCKYKKFPQGERSYEYYIVLLMDFQKFLFQGLSSIFKHVLIKSPIYISADELVHRGPYCRHSSAWNNYRLFELWALWKFKVEHNFNVKTSNYNIIIHEIPDRKSGKLSF